MNNAPLATSSAILAPKTVQFRPSALTTVAMLAAEPNELKDLNLEDSLGVRDDFRNWLISAA